MRNGSMLWIALALLVALPAVAQVDDTSQPVTGDEATVAQQAPTAPQSTSTAPEEPAAEAPDELPQTASPLALLALLGAGSTGAAFAVRRLRR